MRLTLRTLLAYLDDMLEPLQMKEIGAKIAESEQARELMERIKQVTRRRRLTTPTTSGSGGIDPNTIAEYLDSEVTPETAAEVEQICLASDVHLAELASCHQILTLVLGEPALVPPSAKQRMIALVKGPEAIPSRKGRPASKQELDLSSSMELESGVSHLAGAGPFGNRNFLLMVGGGGLIACLLIGVVWQILRTLQVSNPESKGNQVAQNDAKENDTKKTDTPISDDKKKTEPKKKTDTVTPKVEQKNPEEKGSLPITNIPIKSAETQEIAYKPANEKNEKVGVFIAPPAKEFAVLLSANPRENTWTRIAGKNEAVHSNRSLVSLPGSKSVIGLDTQVEVTLWGNLPEVTLDSLSSECRVTLHPHATLDADLTLDRGKIIVRNTRKESNAIVRVRFDNPMLREESYVDITLYGPDAAVVVERFSALDRNEPFFENPKDPLRKGPTVVMRLLALSKSASLRSGQLTHVIDDKNQPIVEWHSRRGVISPAPQTPLPPWVQGTPPLKTDSDKVAREKALHAHRMLASILDKKTAKIGLAELSQQAQDDASRELLADKKILPETFAMWRHAVRCTVAIDDIGSLYEDFSQERTPMPIRGLLLISIHQWLGLHRDHDYRMLEMLGKKTVSIKIIGLFHKISEDQARDPETYQTLIEGLDNNLLSIRVLCHWHLSALVPAGQAIPYDPTGLRQMREEAVQNWMRLIPPGSLPPVGVPKKDKKG